MPIPDLWPEDLGHETSILMPVHIMREQASKLTERTKGLLEGHVESTAPSGDSDSFSHSFFIVAPAVDNYKHLLFWVNHRIAGYPVNVCQPGQPASTTNVAKDEESFVEKLKAIFAQDKTKAIIQALLAQST